MNCLVAYTKFSRSCLDWELPEQRKYDLIFNQHQRFVGTISTKRDKLEIQLGILRLKEHKIG